MITKTKLVLAYIFLAIIYISIREAVDYFWRPLDSASILMGLALAGAIELTRKICSEK